MPPHCDTMDGPVVKAARKALEEENVNLILPFVKKEHEKEIEDAFKKVLEARKDGGAAKEVADLYFFETVVRIHRAGEGASFTGLKPAGLSEGPVIPLAEKAIDAGTPDDLVGFLSQAVEGEIKKRLSEVMRLKKHSEVDVAKAREYVEAMLGLQVWSHKLYLAIKAGPHEEAGEHKHG